MPVDPLEQCDVEIRVRYAECDPMGYLHHAKYFEYFELGRTELLRRSGYSYRDMESAGHYLVIARASCKFLRPVKYDDLLTLTTRVERVTSSRIDHSYCLVREGVRLCAAQTTIAAVDRMGKLVAIPRRLRVL